MKIALIGLDGSGKSANINYMKSNKHFSSFKFLWVRWQPTLLMPIYKLKHSKKRASKIEINENNKNPQNTLNKEYGKRKKVKKVLFSSGIFRKLWMKMAINDYRKQFYKKAGVFLERDNDIIFDRYYLDLFIDQGINFNYTPSQIGDEIVKYQKLFPVIDKVIYIRVSPEVCFERKSDIPNMEYLDKRYEIYEYLSKRFSWIVINGEKSFGEVSKELEKIICED